MAEVIETLGSAADLDDAVALLSEPVAEDLRRPGIIGGACRIGMCIRRRQRSERSEVVDLDSAGRRVCRLI